MSIEDDEYDLDDDILDDAFEEDFEESLDDFNEYDDENEMSFDDDEVLFTDDEVEKHEVEDEAAAVAAGAQKEKFRLNIGTDKLIIIGALIVGLIVLVFQVTTKKPEQKVEVFQSALTMKGASDGEVFGEGQSTSIATTAPQKQQENKAFLYEPDALDQLPNNLKDGSHVEDLTIQPVSKEGALSPKQRQSGFVQVGRSSDDNDVSSPSQGQFVSSTGQLVEQDIQEVIPSKAMPRKSISDKTEQNLNFVPLDQVAVKSQTPTPIVPTVSDKKIEQASVDSQQQDQVQETALPTLTLDPIIQAQKEAAERELIDLRKQIESLREEKALIEQEKMNVQRQTQEAALQKVKAEKEAAQASLKLAQFQKQAEAQAKRKEAIKPKPDVKKLIKKAPVKAPVKVVKKVSPPKVTSNQGASGQTLSNWVLKAVQSDKAWISMKGKRDIVAVKVGDNVPNLGRVTAITKKNSKWVVMTTNGQIVQ